MRGPYTFKIMKSHASTKFKTHQQNSKRFPLFIFITSILSELSVIYSPNSKGDRMEPCGIPLREPRKQVLASRNEHSQNSPKNSNFIITSNSQCCQRLLLGNLMWSESTVQGQGSVGRQRDYYEMEPNLALYLNFLHPQKSVVSSWSQASSSRSNKLVENLFLFNDTHKIHFVVARQVVIFILLSSNMTILPLTIKGLVADTLYTFALCV